MLKRESVEKLSPVDAPGDDDLEVSVAVATALSPEKGAEVEKGEAGSALEGRIAMFMPPRPLPLPRRALPPLLLNGFCRLREEPPPPLLSCWPDMVKIVDWSRSWWFRSWFRG